MQPTAFEVEDGTVLRGLFFSAGSAEAPAPAVVMVNGFSGVKESLVAYAEMFHAAGLNVLLYDNRNFGESGGDTRQHVDPHRQVEDLRYAVSFLQSLPGVDADRIGMMGTSLSGGHALVVAATDRRIRCVVSQSPFVSGLRSVGRFFAEDKQRQLRRLFAQERERRRQGGMPALLPVMSDKDELMCLPPRVSPRFMERSFSDTPQWKNEVTVQSLENFLNYEPIAYIRHVAPTPLLMIVGTRDTICFTDLCLEAYARALEPKRLVTVQGGHWGVYFPPLLEITGGAARDWFVQHLFGEV